MPSHRTLPSGLSPSLRHYLMAGSPDRSHLAPCRLEGWLEMFRITDDETLEAIWTAHRDALCAEAKAAGFTPAGAIWFDGADGAHDGDVLLTPDSRRAAWSAAFCAAHRY